MPTKFAMDAWWGTLHRLLEPAKVFPPNTANRLHKLEEVAFHNAIILRDLIEELQSSKGR